MTTPVKSTPHRRLSAAVALVSALAVGAMALPAAATSDDGPPSDGTAASQRESRREVQRELQRELDEAVRKAGYIGASVQLRDGRHRVHAVAGERKLGTGLPVDHRAEFRAASVTKTFVATVVLQLVAEGRLSLDDTVEKWLPGVVDGNGNDGSRITLRHLLQHTSGVYNYDFREDTGDTAADFERTKLDHHDPAESVAAAMTHRPDFPPADPDDPEPDWNYSNPGYMLAEMIVEKATGRTWAEELRDRVVRPLDLRQTYVPGDHPRLRGAYTHAYNRFPGSADWTDTSVRNMSWAGAAGAVVSTERDLDRFLTALQRGRLLPPTQQAEMRRTVPVSEDFQVPFPDLEYGLGLMRQPLSCGGYRWGHGGDLEGQTVRTAVTGDGRRSVVVNVTGKKEDDEWLLTAERALHKLLDRTLCGPAGGAG